jgi:hypothetical protein
MLLHQHLLISVNLKTKYLYMAAYSSVFKRKHNVKTDTMQDKYQESIPRHIRFKGRKINGKS